MKNKVNNIGIIFNCPVCNSIIGVSVNPDPKGKPSVICNCGRYYALEYIKLNIVELGDHIINNNNSGDLF